MCLPFLLILSKSRSNSHIASVTSDRCILNAYFVCLYQIQDSHSLVRDQDLVIISSFESSYITQHQTRYYISTLFYNIEIVRL